MKGGVFAEETGPDTPARLYMKMYTAADSGKHAFSVIGGDGRVVDPILRTK